VYFDGCDAVNLAIIDSGGANISSVTFACRRLGAEPVFTSDPEVISSADRVILPGVGAARAAMDQLESKNLVACIRELTQPVLGICLGMQLLFDSSTEGDTSCLGIIPARLDRLHARQGLRVPHMGWNSTARTMADPLLSGLPEQPWFYFVHSYVVPVGDYTVAVCEHGQPFSAIVRHRNFRGAQFHPERSAKHGARLLKNFLELPCA
jgi:glutamine amidotransferase